MDYLDYQVKFVDIKDPRHFLEGKSFGMWSHAPNILNVQLGNYISKFLFPTNKVILTDNFLKLVHAIYILPGDQVLTGNFVKAEYLPPGFMVSVRRNARCDFEIISMRSP